MKPIEKPETEKRGDKTGFRWRVLRLGMIKEGVLVPILCNELKRQKIVMSVKSVEPINCCRVEDSHIHIDSRSHRAVEFLFFFSSRRRHTSYWRDWSSDVCSSDLRIHISHSWPGHDHRIRRFDPARCAGHTQSRCRQ